MQSRGKDLLDITRMLPMDWEVSDKVFEVEKHGIYTLRTQHDFGLEGFMLAHCLGTKITEDFLDNHVLFSIRDSRMVPHATILYAHSRETSPYSRCNDFWRCGMAVYRSRGLHLLQVRGRYDTVANVVYHRMAREFHKYLKGALYVDEGWLDGWLAKIGDDDYLYHRAYYLETTNQHNPGWWREHRDMQRV